MDTTTSTSTSITSAADSTMQTSAIETTASNTQSTTSSRSDSSQHATTDYSSLNIAIGVGIGVGIALVLLIVACVPVFKWWKRRRQAAHGQFQYNHQAPARQFQTQYKNQFQVYHQPSRDIQAPYFYPEAAGTNRTSTIGCPPGFHLGTADGTFQTPANRLPNSYPESADSAYRNSSNRYTPNNFPEAFGVNQVSANRFPPNYFSGAIGADQNSANILPPTHSLEANGVNQNSADRGPSTLYPESVERAYRSPVNRRTAVFEMSDKRQTDSWVKEMMIANQEELWMESPIR
ncbi:uncharacterized protein EAE97_010503 [Botrytis byssoidea]|uniref:Uncharacterized protein n=1 Tax=Botrytis byssoidea TaxID=139641 RepID=A0A9P5I2G6_9HELO|nr:uncharacterized protein EAE97_010503 [Botrytis byssoidea]KAF7925422.1 hypothetical protein EAE97_010503 [Botrytis byssoidea]